MKRPLLIIIPLIITLIPNLKAQDLSMGIRIEPMISWFNVLSDNFESGGSHAGFNSGLVLEYSLSDNYALVTGLSIRSNNGNIEFINTDSLLLSNKYRIFKKGDRALIKVQYMNIPLGVKLMTNNYEKIDFYGELGLDLEIRLKAMVRSEGQENNSGYDGRDLVHPAYLGYYLGGGIDYAMTENTKIFAGLKFSNGLLNMTKLHSSRLTANSVILSLGILF
jgi:hypothetical protein